MTKLRVLDLFSGIGGFSLGLERTGGFETVAFCEINPFCRKVLAKHWPKVRQYEDVRELTAERLSADGIVPDVICGGFPCQDISLAGFGAGIDGERSGLWSEYARLVGELRPKFVIVENVAALLGRGLGRVLGNLAALGFDAEWHCIPASAVGAPHRRDRIWIVAHTPEGGRPQWSNDPGRPWPDEHRDAGGARSLADTPGERCKGSGQSVVRRSAAPPAEGKTALFEPSCLRKDWGAEPDVGRVAHGVPSRVDRLRALGNAVVPQIPELIGRAILAAEQRSAA
jgi:DNA (cytosine-5)-methyltransferase 1